jgi:hypothetical protein
MEQEPGSSGVDVIDEYRALLRGFNFDGCTKHVDTVGLCGPVASAAKAGNIVLVAGKWNQAFLDEVEMFPDGPHDDQIVALIGAHNGLTSGADGVYGYMQDEAKRQKDVDAAIAAGKPIPKDPEDEDDEDADDDEDDDGSDSSMDW